MFYFSCTFVSADFTLCFVFWLTLPKPLLIYAIYVVVLFLFLEALISPTNNICFVNYQFTLFINRYTCFLSASLRLQISRVFFFYLGQINNNAHMNTFCELENLFLSESTGINKPYSEKMLIIN